MEKSTQGSKACKTCKDIKPLTEYEESASCKDGYRGSCRACRRPLAAKRAARWRERHPERAKEVDLRYKSANPEKVKETRSAHYVRNAEYYRQKSKAFYHANKERCKALNLVWLEKNRERRAAVAAAWRAANVERRRINYARWEAANYEARLTINRNRRARVKGSGGKLSRDIKPRLFLLQKGRCACCGRKLGSDYHLDHIMPLALGGQNDDSNMQLLRAQCNLSKGARHPIDYMQRKGLLL